MQLLAPNTQPYSTILNNSYLSELDLGDISSKLDIEMAVMLDPQLALASTVENTEAVEQAQDEANDEPQLHQDPVQINTGGNEDDEGDSGLNLNVAYDFKPTNFNFLMLSRFSFATKRKRI